MADPRGFQFSERVKDTKGIVWLAACKAAEKIGCSRGTLLWWERNDCHYLIPKQKLKCWGPPDEFGHYYREKDVQRIAPRFKAAKESLKSPPEIITIKGKEHYSTRKAEQYTSKPEFWLHNHKVPHVIRKFWGRTFAYFPKSKLDGLDALEMLTEKPSDPDVIFREEAEEQVGYGWPVIREIAKKNKNVLHVGKETVKNAAGKRCDRKTLRKSELFSLFINRPDPGKPIVLPNGELWYLRGDALANYNCTSAVLALWEQRASIRNSGPALRKKWFYVIGEHKSRLTAWSCSDLDAIANGEEEVKPRLCGRSLFARKQRERWQKIVKALLFELKKILPIRAKDAFAIAESLGLTSARKMIYRLKNKLGIRTKMATGAGRANFWWCLDSQTPPASGLSQASAAQLEAIAAKCRVVDDQPETPKVSVLAAKTAAAPGLPSVSPEKQKRGAPKGQRPKTAARVANMLDSWDRREFGTNIAAYARDFLFDRSEASRYINAHIENQKRGK
jgi:hypothetical protein